ncbi:MAG: DUF5063 domain-containing protein [Bacteroidales bacterium]|nr:DUF5063 domain-containing protein [Bacteroidales bacterium]RLD38365.1 MAG: hypothetical protein DRI74_04060 [Bacteroidota bacterium]
MSNTDENLTLSKSVLEMITVAHEFCLFMEKIDSYSQEDILNYFQKIIPLLYLKGSLLPDIKVADDSYMERYVTAETWEIIFNELRNKLKPLDNYWVLEFSDDTEATKANIADNLTDVYQDLKDFIILYTKNTQTARENAILECKIQFETHWGIRLLNAVKAIHQIKYNKQK